MQRYVAYLELPGVEGEGLVGAEDEQRDHVAAAQLGLDPDEQELVEQGVGVVAGNDQLGRVLGGVEVQLRVPLVVARVVGPGLEVGQHALGGAGQVQDGHLEVLEVRVQLEAVQVHLTRHAVAVAHSRHQLRLLLVPVHRGSQLHPPLASRNRHPDRAPLAHVLPQERDHHPRQRHLHFALRVHLHLQVALHQALLRLQAHHQPLPLPLRPLHRQHLHRMPPLQLHHLLALPV